MRIITKNKQNEITFSHYIQQKQKQKATQKLQVCSNNAFLTSLNTILKHLWLLEIDRFF